MNRADLIRSVGRAWSFAKKLKLDETFANPAPLTQSEEFRRVIFDENAMYEEEYLVGLRHVQYNFLLDDYSFFQFSINEEQETRFAYYPNPFIGTSRGAIQELADLREYLSEGVISYEEYLHSISDRRVAQHPPLVRYEFAPSQYVEFRHPCAHFHWGHHAENRWAVQRELTPLAFCLLMYKHFYSPQWERGEIEFAAAGEAGPEELLRAEKQNSRILADDLFSPREGRAFHFA